MSAKNSATIERSNGVTQEQMPLLLEEMSRLLDSAQEPREFFQGFLDRLIRATQARGGAVWQRLPDGAFRLGQAQNWNALGLEGIPDGIACHEHVLQVAAQRERALWVPPHRRP